MIDLPADPMSIELTVRHQPLWWQTMDDDDVPEHWHVSADVAELDAAPVEHRHVGDVSLAIADLDPDRNLIDWIEAGEWDLEYIGETILDLAEGTLLPELDEQISDGQPRMVILSRFELTDAWRGFGLAGPLIASTLQRFDHTARLAVCRISPADFLAQAPDRATAELTSLRLGSILDRIGFFLWRGVYVIDLRHEGLIDARLDSLERWRPFS